MSAFRRQGDQGSTSIRFALSERCRPRLGIHQQPRFENEDRSLLRVAWVTPCLLCEPSGPHLGFAVYFDHALKGRNEPFPPDECNRSFDGYSKTGQDLENSSATPQISASNHF